MERDPQIFKALIDNIPSPVFFKGIDGRYLGCNRAFEKHLGRTKDEIVGKTVFDIAPRELAERYKHQDDELFANPGVQEYEAKVKYADGNEHDVIFHKATFNDENGRVAGQVGVILDVSNRKQAEIDLQASENKYRSIFESLYDIYFRVALDGTIQVVSPSVFDRAGYRPEELVGRNVMELYADPGERTGLIAQIGKKHTINDHEITLKKKDGTAGQVSLNMRVVFDDNGNPIALEGTIRDSEQRKRMEESLKESEERFRRLVDDLPEYVFVYREEQILYANQTALRALGYTMEQLSSKNLLEFIAPRDQAMVIDNMRKRACQPVPRYEVNIIDAKGNEHCVLVNADPVVYQGQPAIMTVLYDISVQKEMDRALQASEAKYRKLVEHQGEGIVTADFEEMITYANPAGESIFGVPAGTLTGRRVTEFITIDAAERLASETALRQRGEKSKYELEIVRQSGERRTLLVTAVPQDGEDGKPAGTQAILQDITEQRQAQENLKVSEEKYRSLFANMLNAFAYHRIVQDESGRPIDYEFLEVNDTFERTTGLTRGDIIGRLVTEVMPDIKDDPFDWIGAYGTVALDGRGRRFEQHSLALDKWFSVSAYSPAHGYFVTVFEDITERKRAEEEREKIRLWQTGVNRILESVLAPSPLEKKMKIITDGVVETFGADFCRIWLIEQGDRCGTDCIHTAIEEGPHVCRYRDKCLHLKASSGRYTHIDGKGHRRVPFGAYKIGRIAAGEDEKFLTNDAAHDPRVHNNEWAKELGLVAFAGYRLKPPDGEVLGVFALFTKFPISPDMDALLEGMSRAISLVIQKEIADKAIQFKNILLSTQQESSIDGILVVDENASIVSCNRRFVEMWGIPPELIEEKTDKPVLEFVVDKVSDSKSFLQRVQYLYNHKEETSQEETVLKDGRTFDRYSAPMTGPDGRYYGRIWYFHDSTERKRREKEIGDQALFFETLIDTILNPVFYKDIEGKYIGCNKAFAEFMGIPKDRIAGKTVFDLTPPEKAAQYHKKDMELLKIGGVQTYEYQVKSAKQGLREMQFNKSIYMDGLGNPKGIVGVMVDMTDQTASMREIEKVNRKIKLILDSVGEGIYGLDSQGKTIFINTAGAKLLGYQPEELLGKVQHDLTHHTKLDGSIYKLDDCPIHASCIDGNVYHVVGEIFWRKDGRSFPVEYISTPITEGGKNNGSVVVFRDVAERKQAEALQASLYHISEAAVNSDNLEKLYGEIHKTVTELISAKNLYIALYNEKEGVLSFPYFVDEVDPRPHTRKLGNGLTEYVLKTGVPLLASPEDLNLLIEHGEVSMVGTPAIDWAGVPLKVGNKTLGVLVIQSYREDVRFDAKTLAMLTFISDNVALAISRKNNEEERNIIVAELHKLSVAVEQSANVIAITDLDANMVYVNQAFVDLTGYSREEAMGKNPRILKSGEMDDSAYQRMWQVLLSGGKWQGEFHNKKKNGSLYWEQATITSIKDDHGRPAFYMAVKEDITAQKRDREQLRASEQRFRQVTSSTNEWVWEIDPTGLYTYMNEAVQKIVGYHPDDLVGKKYYYDLFPQEMRDELRQTAQAEFSKRRPIRAFINPNQHKDGRVVTLEMNCLPFFNAERVFLGYRGTNNDITMRRALEEERERLISELQDSLDNIKTLKGLVPICSSCKKIRDDKGYWQQVEVYVAKHTEADFSHGLCDECAHALYPDYFADRKNQGPEQTT